MWRNKLYSKRGCGQCRKRRIKCDEARPACARCRKIGVSCPYLGLTNSRSHSPVDADKVTQAKDALKVQGSGGRVVYFEPFPGCSEETYHVFQYYSHRQSDFCQLADGSPSVSLLKLLPVVCSDASSLIALSAVLTGFLPDSDQQQMMCRTLSTRAMSSMRTMLLSPRTDSMLNFSLMAASLLYLLQLHSEVEPTQSRIHLYGMSAILIAKVNLDPLEAFPLHTSPKWVRLGVGVLLYHLVVSSTIEHSLLDGGPVEGIMHYAVRLIEGGESTGVFGTSILGIPIYLIPVIVALSRLRKAIILKHDTHKLVDEATKNYERVVETVNSTSPAKPIEVLFKHACSIFASALLNEAGVDTSCTEEQVSRNRPSDEINSALVLACSTALPHHTLTWPLLIVGLASSVPAQRDLIQSCLERMIRESRLRSVRSVTDLLSSAWRHESGISILLLPQISSNVVL